MLLEVTISANDSGQRAERFLRRYLPQLSSGRLQSLFRRKEIKVRSASEASAEASKFKAVEQVYSLRPGDVLRVFGLQEEEAKRPEKDAPPPAYPMPTILHEDHELLVVDKPSGVAAHPGSGILPGASLIERVWAYLAEAKIPRPAKIETAPKLVSKSPVAPEPRNPRAKGKSGKPVAPEIETPLEDLLFAGSDGLTPGWGNELFQPALVHRLDKETSGALLVAKSGNALRALTEALRQGKIRKRYLALVVGHPAPAAGTIDAPLARADSAAGAKSLVADDGEEGKSSVTHYKTLKTIGKYALLQVTLETGRMHQIRAHLAHIGHPIVGDTRYDKPASAREHLKALGIKRLFLHAEELAWNDGVKRAYKAPLPAELRKVAGV